MKTPNINAWLRAHPRDTPKAVYKALRHILRRLYRENRPVIEAAALDQLVYGSSTVIVSDDGTVSHVPYRSRRL